MKYIAKKFGSLLLTLLLVSFLSFFAFSVIPGDAAKSQLGTEATPERIEALQKEMGLDRPVLERYASWVTGFFHGDLGTSYSYSMPVGELIRDKVPITIAITVIAFLMILVVSIPIGIFTAQHAGGHLDRLIMTINQVIMSVPGFFIGILITYLFGLILKWFQPGAYVPISENFSGFIGYLVAPSAAIALPRCSMAVKMLRSSVLSQLDADYVRTAYSRGNSTRDAPAMIMDEPTYTHTSLDWHDWWASEDARAYQFIGQDNIYFYCIAQSGMWEALDWNMQQSCVAANYHILYMGKKASSSSQTPPPLAHEMLEHYTPEQLRAHWLSLGLGEKPVSFSPKAFDLRETGKDKDGNPILARDDKRVIDPALKEGALLTGVFNRLARSAFYGVAVKEGDEAAYRTGCIPAGEPSEAARNAAEQAAIAFEQAMHAFELHHALGVCDEFLRAANKRWSDASKAAKNSGDDTAMNQALVDAFHELRVATVLMHGIVPTGCELICEHFAIDPVAFFSWDNIFKTNDELTAELGEQPGTHAIKALPPRFDFFAKHPSQF